MWELKKATGKNAAGPGKLRAEIGFRAAQARFDAAQPASNLRNGKNIHQALDTGGRARCQDGGEMCWSDSRPNSVQPKWEIPVHGSMRSALFVTLRFNRGCFINPAIAWLFNE